jgi:hypothetical protein
MALEDVWRANSSWGLSAMLTVHLDPRDGHLAGSQGIVCTRRLSPVMVQGFQSISQLSQLIGANSEKPKSVTSQE